MRWHLLVHQLPPRPLYLRAKVRQRLARVGALALKNSVYVLPARPECLEDLQWIAQEAEAGGGEAFVCAASFVSGVEDGALLRRFREESSAHYRQWAAEARRALRAGTAAAGGARLRHGRGAFHARGRSLHVRDRARAPGRDRPRAGGGGGDRARPRPQGRQVRPDGGGGSPPAPRRPVRERGG